MNGTFQVKTRNVVLMNQDLGRRRDLSREIKSFEATFKLDLIYDQSQNFKKI